LAASSLARAAEAAKRRRDVLALFGCLPIAWPVAAGAQQSERTRRVGIFHGTDDDDLSQARNTEFLNALQERGWIGGRNLKIETRWGAGDADHISKFATEFAALAPDVIFATGTPNRRGFA
jgi:putative tryptophan/tyrosine transport system substrate-binding protein